MVKSWYPFLALLVSHGYGAADCYKLPKDYERTFDLMRTASGLKELSKALGREISEISWERFENQLHSLEKYGVNVVCALDKEFPSYLCDVPLPPALLFYKGDLKYLHRRGVAVVGTRKPSASGALFARKMASDLASSGIMVASGLARGIDTAAHEGSLAMGGPSVGVMGTGLDISYPPENEHLIEELIAEGCVFSEQLMGTMPAKHVFPRRNRLISAIVHAVVVVQAGERSGAKITAQWALEQGREVGAVPGFPGDFRSKGVNALLKKGAFLVESVDDIFDAVPLLKASRRAIEEPSLFDSLPGSCGTFAGAGYLGISSEMLKKVLSELSSEPASPDDLAKRLGMEVSTLSGALSALEMAGEITVDNMGSYYRI